MISIGRLVLKKFFNDEHFVDDQENLLHVLIHARVNGQSVGVYSDLIGIVPNAAHSIALFVDIEGEPLSGQMSGRAQTGSSGTDHTNAYNIITRLIHHWSGNQIELVQWIDRFYG